MGFLKNIIKNTFHVVSLIRFELVVCFVVVVYVLLFFVCLLLLFFGGMFRYS